MDKFIRLPEVQQISGAKRSTLYGLIQKGEFPKPVKLSERSVAWLESEVISWCAERIKKSRPDGAHMATKTSLTKI